MAAALIWGWLSTFRVVPNSSCPRGTAKLDRPASSLHKPPRADKSTVFAKRSSAHEIESREGDARHPPRRSQPLAVGRGAFQEHGAPSRIRGGAHAALGSHLAVSALDG